MLNRVRRRMRRAVTTDAASNHEIAALRASLDALSLELRDLNATTTNGYRAAVDQIRAELDHGLTAATTRHDDFDRFVRSWVPESVDALRVHLEAHTGEAVDNATKALQLRLRRVERSAAAAPAPSADAPGTPADAAPVPAAVTPVAASSGASGFDVDYSSFEDELRGSAEHVKALEAVHVDTIRGLGAEGLPVVDVGCGRGELLQLLRDADIPARGVDLNPVSVQDCIDDGLDCVHGDAVQMLASLPEGSLRAVVGLHIVEHMTDAERSALFASAHRALAEGGGVIFETPNPENLRVGATTFWLDPTHLRPVPPQLLAFQVESAGFDDVEIQRLHPTDDLVIVADDADPLAVELAGRFNRLISGPQDYAVVGRKLAAGA